MSYDPETEHLAKHHLGDDADPKLIAALCEELQACVETFMENLERDRKTALSPSESG